MLWYIVPVSNIRKEVTTDETGQMKQALKKKLKSVRPLLFAQILFVIFAFVLMCVIGYVFMKNIVHEYMIVSTESMLDYEQSRIEADLMAPKTASGIFAETVRRMILNGADIDELQTYISEISDYMRLNEAHSSSFGGILCYFDKLSDGPALLSDLDTDASTGRHITESAWYRSAVAAGSNVAETVIENDPIFGETVLAYSQCLLDDRGRRLGVVCFIVRIDVIGASIVGMTLNMGGYGTLLSKELAVLAHPNEEFLGKGMKNPALGISAFAEELVEKKKVNEREMNTWLGDPAIAFFRELNNGWFLGVVMLKEDYFKSITYMAWVLGLLSAALATALVAILLRIEAAKNKANFESKQKSVFLANMSHEIRTPMNAIISMTHIGKLSNYTDRKDYCFMRIEDASQHLLGVINDILDMSKIEANMFELSEEEYRFEKMLQRVVNVVNFRVEEKQQKFSVHIDKNIPGILIGDDQRLAQVVTNLLGNAVKFTPESGTIRLHASLLEENNGIYEIKIAVTDTGIGISPEQQKKLFRSFQQAESSTTRKFGGTGLGLAISKNIVDMMGGRIWVESEVGQGTTFFFTILVKKGEEREESFADAYANWNSVRILTVDDDPEILMYFQEILKDFGASCDTAESGEEALELVEQNGPYNIYLVDWKMPGMDGIELARALKLKTSLVDNPVVIMISAAEWSVVEEDAKKAGVDKFLSKPLFPSDIAYAINEVLGTKQQMEKEKGRDNIGEIFAERHILLAEDVEINREIVISLLEPTRIEIDYAENGLEAVRLFSESPNKYDAILMDVQMPEMDGYDATRRIRALNNRKATDVPIIALTANVFREDIEQCSKAGMNDHLGKPIDSDELINKLRKYLIK